MTNETRAERILERAIVRASTPRGGAMVIAALTTSATIIAGLLMTAIDHKNFTTVGGGLWWAVQTVTTVGYGDKVPSNTAGKIVASLVMLLGLAFLSVVTAAITSSFVSRAAERRVDGTDGVAAAAKTDSVAPATKDDVRELNKRFDAMEALLRERS
jgi:voltage-gated potassium channel